MTTSEHEAIPAAYCDFVFGPIERPPSQVPCEIVRYRDGEATEVEDVVAAEEPLEIRLIWEHGGRTEKKSIAVTMRTPGDDFELAAGFLHGEGILRGSEDIADIAYCTDEEEDQAFNIVTVTLRPGLAFDESRLDRNFYTTSSCGICGKATLDALEVQGCAPLPPRPVVDLAVITSLPAKIREAQALFETTGGLHGAGLFDTDGRLLSLKEDVGRHNALDKLIGERLLSGALPEEHGVLCLSGRASFELLQKALMARIPVVAAVGAPSSLAVQLAAEFNITLAGFVRPGGCNVYAGRERLRA